MTQKASIFMLLQQNGAMTQSALAASIYGDKNHVPYIYASLQELVRQGVVVRTGANPAYYTLREDGAIVDTLQREARARRTRDVSTDVIDDHSLEEAARMVAESRYGPEFELITRVLQKHPLNTDPDIIAMKIALIDVVNSTNLSKYKNEINLAELSQFIAGIRDIDARIAAGDPEVVNEIARNNGGKNLFSFASKYCCYHNYNLYGKDDYSIFDSVLKRNLPRYFGDITAARLERWRTSFCYREYNDYIAAKLDALGVNIEGRRRKFDHFVWFKNK